MSFTIKLLDICDMTQHIEKGAADFYQQLQELTDHSKAQQVFGYLFDQKTDHTKECEALRDKFSQTADEQFDFQVDILKEQNDLLEQFVCAFMEDEDQNSDQSDVRALIDMAVQLEKKNSNIQKEFADCFLSKNVDLFNNFIQESQETIEMLYDLKQNLNC